MADLPDNSFVKVNDIETAADAPVTEALAQKLGTNDNTNDAEITALDVRVTALETENWGSTGFLSGGNVTSTGVIFSAAVGAITGSGVLVTLKASFSAVNISGTTTATLEFRRDTTVLWTQSISSAGVSDATFEISFIDTGVSNGNAYSYNMNCSAISLGGGTVTYGVAALSALDVK